MDLKKKVFSIGKWDIEQWQLILGAIASILAIVTFFKKSNTQAPETPYSINVAPAEQTDSSSGSASPSYEESNYMDSSLLDTFTLLGDSISSLNTKLDNQSMSLAELNNSVGSAKSPTIIERTIINTVAQTTPAIVTTPAPIVATTNHDASAVVSTAGDSKINTSIANTPVTKEQIAKVIANDKIGVPISDVNTWNAVTDSVKKGTIKPSMVSPASKEPDPVIIAKSSKPQMVRE